MSWHVKICNHICHYKSFMSWYFHSWPFTLPDIWTDFSSNFPRTWWAYSSLESHGIVNFSFTPPNFRLVFWPLISRVILEHFWISSNGTDLKLSEGFPFWTLEIQLTSKHATLKSNCFLAFCSSTSHTFHNKLLSELTSFLVEPFIKDCSCMINFRLCFAEFQQFTLIWLFDYSIRFLDSLIPLTWGFMGVIIMGMANFWSRYAEIHIVSQLICRAVFAHFLTNRSGDWMWNNDRLGRSIDYVTR